MPATHLAITKADALKIIFEIMRTDDDVYIKINLGTSVCNSSSSPHVRVC